MKKLVSLIACFCILTGVFVSCVSTSNVDYVPDRIEKNVTLPDGAKGDILFSQKWFGELSKYANDKTQWQGKDSVLNTAKTETDLGYGSVWHNKTENTAVETLCNIMEESGFKYGVAYVNYGNRIRRYALTYKKNKLKNSFMDFFDPSHEFYIAYNKKESEKQKKREEKVTEAILSSLTPSSSASINEAPEQTLYRLRHLTEDISYIGGSQATSLQYRYIYYDNGTKVQGYIVDLNGNIRSENGRIGMKASVDEMYPIVPKHSVPKEIRNLAMKSLE